MYEWKFLFVDDMSLESIEDRVLLNSVRFLIEKLLKSPASQPLNLNSTTRRILWKVFLHFKMQISKNRMGNIMEGGRKIKKRRREKTKSIYLFDTRGTNLIMING